MPLNIKDENVHAQARRLAGLTGTSITAAVRDALGARLRHLEKEQREGKPNRSAGQLLEVARACAAAIKAKAVSSDHSDLYDDEGLPR